MVGIDLEKIQVMEHMIELEIQASVMKQKLQEIDDRDYGPSDTFDCMVSEDPISDEDLDDCVRIYFWNDRIKVNPDNLCSAGNPKKLSKL